MINLRAMKKKLPIILSLSFLVVGAGVFGVMIFKMRSSDRLLSPKSETQPTPTPEIEWGLWEDQFGFSFEYPTNLEVEQVETEGRDSNVVLSSMDGGKISVSFGEAPQETIEEWFKDYKEATASSKVEDIKLSEKDAKKVYFEGGKRMVTAMIDEWDLIVIDGTLGDDELLKKTYDKILESFYLEPIEEGEPAPAAGGGEAFEGEELFLEGVIEE